MIKIAPNPIIFEFGPIKIYWYGFLIFLAFWVIFFLSLRWYKKYNLNLSKDDIYNLSFWLLLGGLIGGRLYYLFSELPYYLKNPQEIFFFWQGGLGLYGGLIFGFFILFIFAKKKKIPFLPLLDFYSPLAILAIAIIRWGNFFNQELYGLPTNQRWGLFISLENRLPGYEKFSFFQPIFLYESIFCLILFLFLCLRGKNKKFNGELFFWTSILYSLFRFFIEFIRLYPQPIFLSLRLNQWFSLFIFTFSLFFIFKTTRQSKTL